MHARKTAEPRLPLSTVLGIMGAFFTAAGLLFAIHSWGIAQQNEATKTNIEVLNEIAKQRLAHAEEKEREVAKLLDAARDTIVTMYAAVEGREASLLANLSRAEKQVEVRDRQNAILVKQLGMTASTESAVVAAVEILLQQRAADKIELAEFRQLKAESRSASNNAALESRVLTRTGFGGGL